MKDMRTRIARGDINMERVEAIQVRLLIFFIQKILTNSPLSQAMCDIAKDRATKLQSS